MKTEQQTAKRPDRRLFLKTSATAAAGLSLGFYLPGRSDASNTPRLNAWVEVLPNETVVIRYARTEMGQGSRTSAPQLVAEELDADWSRVRVEYVPAHENLASKRAYGDMATVGSRTIRQSQDYCAKPVQRPATCWWPPPLSSGACPPATAPHPGGASCTRPASAR